jgi:hypothetical protein
LSAISDVCHIDLDLGIGGGGIKPEGLDDFAPRLDLGFLPGSPPSYSPESSTTGLDSFPMNSTWEL